MPWTAGVDGCKDGWLAVFANLEGAVETCVAPDFAALLAHRPRCHLLAIDIPIGLAANGPRECDLLARQHLIGKGSSVFPPPLRGTLAARDYAEAKALNRQASGKAITLQAWHILDKIREVDMWLRAAPHPPVYEAHPELALQAMNGGRPLEGRKRLLAGRRERRVLLVRGLGKALVEKVEAQAALLRQEQRFEWDDLYDALALLWTSRRLHREQAVTLPPVPPRDALGLPMSISF